MSVMADTPGRMLELLGLLQARPSWSGLELSDRLEVTERTVRRDIDRLRVLGFPVEAVPGRYGGYRLGRGGTLPPLLLNDDETVAVAIGLRAAVDGTIDGLEESAVSALAKLDQLLPVHLARRIRAVHDNTASVGREGRRERIVAAHLLLLAHACSASERVRFDYTDKGGRPSLRLVEPLRVVRTGARWYLAARDIDRADWRTFRLDRIRNPENVGTRFEHLDPPDPAELISRSLAAMPYPFVARILLPVGLDEAGQLIPRTMAMFDSRDGGTVVELGSASMARMVGYLAGLRPPCQVLDPPELRQALADHARDVAAANQAPE
jgi:predicted DNA-binding transcriptional regulator YafY